MRQGNCQLLFFIFHLRFFPAYLFIPRFLSYSLRKPFLRANPNSLHSSFSSYIPSPSVSSRSSSKTKHQFHNLPPPPHIEKLNQTPRNLIFIRHMVSQLVIILLTPDHNRRTLHTKRHTTSLDEHVSRVGESTNVATSRRHPMSPARS